ncbi:MAG TPA: hypothetical protein VLL25_18050 [Acidimicrobiales bacterium]|nr:hypothetical protein [Acidimicrobiales bacterium]
MTPNADSGGHRDALGRRVREAWIAWAQRQPTPKSSWLVPYDDLAESDKEADRCIGSALWGDGFADGMNHIEAVMGLPQDDRSGVS